MFSTYYTNKNLPKYKIFYRKKMVGLARLELATSRLSGVRSNRLSYKPLK